VIASPLSQININPQILQRQMRLYVTRLIAKAKKSPTLSESTKEMVLNFLDKSKLLGDTQRYVQLLEHFANDLQKSTHIGMLDQHLDTALANPELSNKLRVELSSLRILLLIRRGELALAQQVLDGAWAAADMPLLQAILHNREGVLLKVSGMYEASQQQYEEALRLALSQNDLALISSIYNNLGNLAHAQDNYQEAVTYYTNGLQAAEELGAPRHCAPLEGGLAMTLDELEQYEEANRYHAIARIHYSEAGHLMGVVRCDLNQSLQALMRGKFVEAKALAGRALELALQLGDTSRLAAAWHNLGHAYQIEGKYEIAAEYMLKALQRRRWLGESFYEEYTFKQIKKLIKSLEADNAIDPARRQKILQPCYDALKNNHTR
jgi:tetratricopeptide (TPR) repeat protein